MSSNADHAASKAAFKAGVVECLQLIPSYSPFGLVCGVASVQAGLGEWGAVALAAGADHSLTLTSDGTVVAWGYNGNGQLGDGSTANSNTAVAVGGASRGRLPAVQRRGPHL